MSQVVRKLKINKRLASSACLLCGDALTVGEDGAVCEACEGPHHARCWDDANGCGQTGCVNAPLPDTLDAGSERRLRSDEKQCLYCKEIIYVDADTCRHCGRIASTDGVYHGEQTIAPEARLALLYAIAGLFCCFGLILGPLAFKNGMDAKKAIATNPKLRGRAMATTAQGIGIVAVVFWLGLFAFNPESVNTLAYWMGYLAIPGIIFVLLVLFIRWKLNRS
jgi:RNA polymerase subunit RPABC4/transcription elongation factor Spt4